MNQSYIRVLQAIAFFCSEHLQINKFASDFPAQLPNLSTIDDAYPVLFVSPSTTIFDENATTFSIDVYCFDIIQKDRSNINTILSDTNLILNDLKKWLQNGDIFGMENIEVVTATPINNALLDYAAGWVMNITIEAATYNECEIPFNNIPVISGITNEIRYERFLTCVGVVDCPAIAEVIARVDVYVSGGTYEGNVGDATYTYNIGSGFTVSGLSTDKIINDSIITGLTVTEALDQTTVWKGKWSQDLYRKNQQVIDNSFLAIANKDTEDRPAPQPIGEPDYLYSGGISTTSVNAKQVIFGNRYQFNENLFLEGWRVNVIAGNNYSVYLVEDPIGLPVVTQIIQFTANNSGWIPLNISKTIISSGSTYDLVVTVSEPDPTPVTFTGNWDYEKPTNATNPTSGQITHANKALGELRISKTDNDSNDRSAELGGLNIGDIITISTTRWAIQASTDNGTFFSFSISPAIQLSTAGVKNFTFETVSPTPITYPFDTNFWSSFPPLNITANGLLGIDTPYVNIVTDNTAYGVDILVRECLPSLDWDIQAFTSVVSSNGSGGGSDTVITINGVEQNLTSDREWLTALANTGILNYGTGITSSTLTSISISAMDGYIVNNETNPTIPTHTYVTYSGNSNVPITTIGGGSASYVLLNSTGNIVFQNTFPTSAERKTKIWIGKIAHPEGQITAVINEADFITSPLSQLRDLFQALTYINRGVYPYPNGNNMNVNITFGHILGNGINLHKSNTVPNEIQMGATIATPFLYRTQSGGTSSATTFISGNTYDVSGVTTPVPTTASTIQYIFAIPDTGFVVQFGQHLYPSLNDAIISIGREQFVTWSNLIDNSILIGVLALTSTATTLEDSSQAQFFRADKFGQIVSSQVGVVIATTTLQDIYDNSVQPQLTINPSIGALQVKGIGDGTDSILQGLDSLNSVNFNVSSNGSLTANTISATTFFGLPKDVFVSGGSFEESASTLTLTNTSGGSFSVSGITPASSNAIRVPVRNNSGSSIPKGSVVYITGAVGQRATIALALADSNVTTSLAVGITEQTIANNANGSIIAAGEILTLDTSAFSDGDRVYLSSTIPGALTTTIPTSPDNTVFVGTITNAHPTQGKILVNIVYTFKLDNLTDVSASGTSDGQILIFNGSNQLWENRDIPSTFTGLTATTILTNSLTASTISATTYLGLPPDVYVTGGTYSNATGTATYSNNTGGTFDVTGFTTGGTILDIVWEVGASGNFSIRAKNDSSTNATADYAVAEGFEAHAQAFASHAEGSGTQAAGEASHTEGFESFTQGKYSHAEGQSTSTAINATASHAEGYQTIAEGFAAHAEGRLTTALGTYSHAEGWFTNANGDRSHAEGRESTAQGTNSHAEGWFTNANGDSSHAEGRSTNANGFASHAEGNSTTAIGDNSHAGGGSTIAYGTSSFVHGSSSQADNDNTIVLGALITGTSANTTYVDNFNIKTLGAGTSINNLGIDANGYVVIGSGSGSSSGFDVFVTGGTKIGTIVTFTNNTGGTFNVTGFSTGGGGGDGVWTTGSTGNFSIRAINDSSTDATNNYAVAEGISTLASGIAAHAEGNVSEANGDYSHAEGLNTRANGGASHSEGDTTQAIGLNSHAEGTQTIAQGDYSHAEGFQSNANGNYSHTEGYINIANGIYCHAEGALCVVGADYSHSEGINTQALGAASHTKGGNTVANGTFSYASGLGSIANGQSSFVHGESSTADAAATIVLGNNIFGANANTTYVEGFNIRDLGAGASINNLGIDASGYVVVGTGGGTPIWSIGSSGSFSIKAVNDTTTDATGSYAVAEGADVIANGVASHAEGNQTQTNNDFCHSEGFQTQANGVQSHAEGYQSIAAGESCHAEGTMTTAGSFPSASFCHSEGINTQTNAAGSHAQNANTIANGFFSHAGGLGSTADGTCSFVHGDTSQAAGLNTVVLGANIIGNQPDTTYVDNFNIRTLGAGTSVETLGRDVDGYIVTVPALLLINTNIGISATTFVSGSTAQDKTLVVDNGATNITYTIQSPINTKIVKVGTGSINFLSGGTMNVIPITGTMSLSGMPGSEATILTVGNNVYLKINNYTY